MLAEGGTVGDSRTELLQEPAGEGGLLFLELRCLPIIFEIATGPYNKHKVIAAACWEGGPVNGEKFRESIPNLKFATFH